MFHLVGSARRKSVAAALCATTAVPLVVMGSTDAQAASVVQTKNIMAHVKSNVERPNAAPEACLDVTVASSDGSHLRHWAVGLRPPASGWAWMSAKGTASVGDTIEIYEFGYSNGSMCQGKVVATGSATVARDSLANTWVNLS